MNRELADTIAAATLYEGYILYPYRPSVKTQQRWTFGGVYPKAWSESQAGTDPHEMQAEILATGDEQTSVRVIIRFLHLVDRAVGKFAHPLNRWTQTVVQEYQLVPLLDSGEMQYQPWQEAIERTVEAGEFNIKDLAQSEIQTSFSFAGETTTEPVTNGDGQIVGLLIRKREKLDGAVKLFAEHKSNGLYKIRVVIQNTTPFEQPEAATRDEALMRSLVSTHLILGASGGEFVSLMDAPSKWQQWTAECRNTGLWPVLIGTGTEHDTMLASPIILYDYPQLAPESPGDLFDATEIDEILTLRILTLTDEEKRAAASVDPRAKDMLAHTTALAHQQLMNLHGTIRGLTPVAREAGHG